MSLIRHVPPSHFSRIPSDRSELLIHHPAPGLPRRPPLLVFPAYDRTPDGKWGVHYHLVLEACCILANNGEGYISSTPNSQGRVSGTTSILKAGCYYYVVPDKMDPPYPVVPSFDAWSFPSKIPTRWSDAFNTDVPVPGSVTPAAYGTAAMALRVTERDKACILTKYSAGIVNCHLVPQAHLNWYLTHKMWIYSGRTASFYQALLGKVINTSSNGVTLRADIRNLFDDHVLAFVVKENRLACHFLRSCPQLAELYHNAPITLPSEIPPEIVYARFAWAIIEQAGVTTFHNLPLVSPVPGAARDDAPQSPESDEHDVSAGEAESPLASSLLSPDVIADAFYRKFPDLSEEVSYSADRRWQTLAFHPESVKMDRLRQDWRAQHPNVSETSGPTADVSSDDEDDEERLSAEPRDAPDILPALH